MSKKRTCKRCHAPLSDMDPHTICKSCRQPDPQMFYCSEDDCEACSVIKVYKPLDLLLRKQELENMAKKLSNPLGNYSPKHDETYSKKKSLDTSNKNQFVNFSAVMEDKLSGVSPDIVNTLLKRICRDKGEAVSQNSSKSDGSFPGPSTSFGNDKEGYKDLESRLFDRIMSTLMTSLSSESKAGSPETNSITPTPKVSSTMPSTGKNTATKPAYEKVAASSSSRDSLDLSSTEDELEDNLISLFSAINPDCLAKASKGPSECGKNDYIFKISSRASDLLLTGTVLSSPSQASNLSCDLEFDDMSYWPVNLTAADVLHKSFLKLPNMKLHPKVRHMHTVLFGRLNPSLPPELMSENYSLPNMSLELKNEFYFAREQLQRILLMFSMVDYFSNEKCVQETPPLTTLVELLLNQLKVLLEKQANFVGLLFQEIRRDLLCDTECKEPDAVSKLIMGPAHLSQFFGPYVKELRDIIQQRGSSYRLSSKSENANVNLFKLPIKFREGDNSIKFLTNLQVYFESNLTKTNDKFSVFESLMPKVIIDRLTNLVKPKKLSDLSFDEVASLFKKVDQTNGSNYLLERHVFSKLKQNKGQSIKNYATLLENSIPDCKYDFGCGEILRDQFVFGLSDESIQKHLLCKFSWSFEECVLYACGKEQKESLATAPSSESVKKSVKRKAEDEVPASKKPKSEAHTVDSSEFYNTPLFLNRDPKHLPIKVNNLSRWNDFFGFDAKYQFDVYCPWTGKVLRN